MRRWALAMLGAVMAVALAPAAVEAQDQVALTFDDLPSLTLLKSQAYVDYNNTMILRGLKHHHMPAIGFVNEGKLDDADRARQIADLKMWLDAGQDLGNHTYDHVSPNDIPAKAYIADIARGERVTRPMMAKYHKTETWFRYPYLETGKTLQEKTAIQDWLKTHGYRIAPVTMENSDWLFAEPYDDAIARHQDARARKIRAQYLAYTDLTVGWYISAGHALVNRPMAFVMLMHVTRLNADSFDDIATILKKHRLKTITLDAAMKDPIYQTADTYVGADGNEWLERWSTTLNKELPWDSFKDPPADIAAQYKKIDNDIK